MGILLVFFAIAMIVCMIRLQTLPRHYGDYGFIGEVVEAWPWAITFLCALVAFFLTAGVWAWETWGPHIHVAISAQ